MKEDRRSGIDRRRFSYDAHVPERRSGRDRRNKRNKVYGSSFAAAIQEAI